LCDHILLNQYQMIPFKAQPTLDYDLSETYNN